MADLIIFLPVKLVLLSLNRIRCLMMWNVGMSNSEDKEPWSAKIPWASYAVKILGSFVLVYSAWLVHMLESLISMLYLLSRVRRE